MSLSQTPSPSAGCKGRAHKESSLLAPKVRVQPLLEIYTSEVRFTIKNYFFPEDIAKPDACVVGEKTFSTQLDMKDTTLSNGVNVEKTTPGEPFCPAALAFPIYRDSAS